MNDLATVCPSCGTPLERGVTPCPSCGSPLAGTAQVAIEPLREEATLVFELLRSAGLHPILAYDDEEDVPHPIDPQEPFTQSAGLLMPVVTSFAVYVPESEADDARRILDDARHALEGDNPDAGGPYQDVGGARPPRPKGIDQT